jgi:hypothetical protein
MKVSPEMRPMLTTDELDYQFVLEYGLAAVGKEDAWEIIQYSIHRHQQRTLLH